MSEADQHKDIHRGRGALAGAISTAIVQATKEHSGQGPTKCRTYIDDDFVIVLMREGYTRLEDTLFEDGKWLDVRDMRHTFQDTMQARYSEIIGRMTDRTVVAFMSASHQHPDLQMEIFVLEPMTAEDPTPLAAKDPSDPRG